MGEILRRLVWFTIVSSAVAYATYLILGSAVNARESGMYRPILVRDELGPGSHHLSGMVTVETPCDELSVHTESISSSSQQLQFKTWLEPSVDCGTGEVPRPFKAVLFAPSTGVHFTATLNGKDLPITVLPTISNAK